MEKSAGSKKDVDSIILRVITSIGKKENLKNKNTIEMFSKLIIKKRPKNQILLPVAMNNPNQIKQNSKIPTKKETKQI